MKLDDLRRPCETEGQDYDEIAKCCAFAFEVSEKVGELIGQLRWLAGMVVKTVIGFVPNVDRIRSLMVIFRAVILAIADYS